MEKAKAYSVIVPTTRESSKRGGEISLSSKTSDVVKRVQTSLAKVKKA